MRRSIRPDKAIDRSHLPNKHAKTYRRPATRILEIKEDLMCRILRTEDPEDDKHGCEAEDVEDKKDAFD